MVHCIKIVVKSIEYEFICSTMHLTIYFAGESKGLLISFMVLTRYRCLVEKWNLLS